MSTKEMYNVIQALKAMNASDEQIIAFIEYVETADAEKLERIAELYRKATQDSAQE